MRAGSYLKLERDIDCSFMDATLSE